MPEMPTYQNEDGEPIQLTGKNTGAVAASSGESETKHWVDRMHFDRGAWIDAERRMRASYLATRDLLVDYLVPHRFEGAVVDPETGTAARVDPRQLPRAEYGYGIGLNAAYLDEIIGHVRGAPARYNWGPLSNDEEPVTYSTTNPGKPSDGLALDLWRDATRGNVTWPNFFGRIVLEWIASSVGGFVLVDNVGVQTASKAEERAAAKRPFVRFIPWSIVEDYGWGEHGLRWIKLAEWRDERDPRVSEQQRLTRYHVLYELDGDTSIVTRHDEDGKVVGEAVEIGELYDKQGHATLPLIEARIGSHETINHVGRGLLYGLDDIVIDLFNVMSEAREGFRDSSFGMLTYRGPEGDAVRNVLAQGTRYADLGDDPDASLDRVAGDSGEVTAGMTLFEIGLEAWKLSAKRRATKTDSVNAMSGVALQAQFALDITPTLRDVAERIDEIETNTMHVAGQMGDRRKSPDELEEVGVVREREFRPEDEAARIARIVDDFREEIDLVPAEARAEIAMRWIEASGLVDLDDEIELADGSTMPAREFYAQRADALAQRMEDATATASGFGSLLGGNGGPVPPSSVPTEGGES